MVFGSGHAWKWQGSADEGSTAGHANEAGVGSCQGQDLSPQAFEFFVHLGGQLPRLLIGVNETPDQSKGNKNL